MLAAFFALHVIVTFANMRNRLFLLTETVNLINRGGGGGGGVGDKLF